MQANDNSFWQFSVEFYQDSKVSKQCLFLQDTEDADVNIVLLCVWMGLKGVVLSREFFQRLLSDKALTLLRRDTIIPLRKIRAELKQQNTAPAQGLRQQVLALELKAEKKEQDLLYALVVDDIGESVENVLATVSNLCSYLRLSGLKAVNWHHIGSLVSAAFPAIDEVKFNKVLTQIAGQ